MPVKAIAGLATIGMATAVAIQPIKLIKKKNVKTKDVLEVGLTTMVGTSLLPVQARFVGMI